VSKFGEPWAKVQEQYCAVRAANGDDVVTGNGDDMGYVDVPEEYRNRMLACVNALAGIADPGAWVEAVKELIRCTDPAEDGDMARVLAKLTKAEGKNDLRSLS